MSLFEYFIDNYRSLKRADGSTIAIANAIEVRSQNFNLHQTRAGHSL